MAKSKKKDPSQITAKDLLKAATDISGEQIAHEWKLAAKNGEHTIKKADLNPELFSAAIIALKSSTSHTTVQYHADGTVTLRFKE